MSSNVGTSTGIVGATLLSWPLPLAAAAETVVANALGCPKTLDCTIGVARATGDYGRKGEPATGITCGVTGVCTGVPTPDPVNGE